MFINKRIKSKKISDSKGFTLIEVLVAMAIFSIGILAVASMQLAGTKGSSSARFSTEAAVLAQSQMESLLALEYDQPPATPVPELTAGLHGPFPNSKYTVEWFIEVGTLNAIALPANSLGITVTVSWQQKSYSLNFIKSARI